MTVEPAERYLAYLAAIERSPNTVRADAQSLALWCEFLELRQVGWAVASVEDVSEFVTTCVLYGTKPPFPMWHIRGTGQIS